jgi:hypothetical protein
MAAYLVRTHGPLARLVNQRGARALQQYLVDPAAQGQIRSFRLSGIDQPIFLAGRKPKRQLKRAPFPPGPEKMTFTSLPNGRKVTVSSADLVFEMAQRIELETVRRRGEGRKSDIAISRLLS